MMEGHTFEPEGIADVAAFLRGSLGELLTALVGSAKSSYEVGLWAEGSRSPSDEQARSLRGAYGVYQLYRDPNEARRWLMIRNDFLDGDKPVVALSKGRASDVERALAREAVKAF